MAPRRSWHSICAGRRETQFLPGMRLIPASTHSDGTQIVVIESGRVVSEGTVEEIRATSGVGRVRFRAEPIPEDLDGRVVRDGETISVYTRDPSAAVHRLVHAGARLERLEVTPLSLEEALKAQREV